MPFTTIAKHTIQVSRSDGILYIAIYGLKRGANQCSILYDVFANGDHDNVYVYNNNPITPFCGHVIIVTDPLCTSRLYN